MLRYELSFEQNKKIAAQVCQAFSTRAKLQQFFSLARVDFRNQLYTLCILKPLRDSSAVVHNIPYRPYL